MADFDYLRHQLVQNMAVVTDQHDRTREALQRFEQRLLGDDIEVVGRFVEQHEVIRVSQRTFARASRARSPPERTPTRLLTSSPENSIAPSNHADLRGRHTLRIA